MAPRHKTIRLLCAITFLLLAWHDGTHVLPLIDVAHAQVRELSGMQSSLGWGMSFVLTALNVLTWIIFRLMETLLDPRVIFDLDNGSLLVILNQIWQLSRDLMNVLFAFMLVFAAMYVILLPDKKEFVTNNLVKFVLSVLLVNFSWFAPQVIIDVANVTTAAIYGIPSLLPVPCQYRSARDEGACAQIAPGEFLCPCTVITDIKLPLNDTTILATCPENVNGWKRIGNLICYREVPMNGAAISTTTAVINGLVVNHGRLRNMAIVADPVAGGGEIGQWIGALLRQTLLLVIHIGLTFPLFAMLVAFLIRIPVLWVTMSFMPFAFLGILAGDRFGQMNPKRIFDLFLKATFLPAMTAVPLTVGFIILNAAAPLNYDPFLNVNIRLLDQVTNLWGLLWLLICLMVIWMGVFAVLKNAEIMGKGAQAIEGIGRSAGLLALKLPLAIPTIPGTERGGPGTGITPLQAAKMLDPRRLEGTLSSTGSYRGLKKCLEEQVKGEAGGGYVAKGEIDSVKLNITQDQVNTLKGLIKEAAGGDATKFKEIADYLKTQNGKNGEKLVDPGRALSKEDLVKLFDELKLKGADTNPYESADVQKKFTENARKK